MDNEKIIFLPDIKTPLALGGSWTMQDKSDMRKLISHAREANQKQFENLYKCAACLETSDINEARAYALFHNYKKKAISLAALMAIKKTENAPPSFDIFTLTDERGESFFWAVTIENGLVQVDGDTVYYNKSAAYQAQMEFEKTFSNGQVMDLGPEESLAYLTEFFQGCDKKALNAASLVFFHDYKKYLSRIGIGIAALIVFGVVGKHQYDALQEEKDRVAERIRIEQETQRSIEALKKSLYPPVWIKEPTPGMIMEDFRKELAKVPFSVNSWRLSGTDYNKGQYTFIYSKDPEMAFTMPPGKVDPSKPFLSRVHVKSSLKIPDREHGLMTLGAAGKWLMEFSLGKPYRTVYRLQNRESQSKNVPHSDPVTIWASYQKYDIHITNIRGDVLYDVGRDMDVPGMVITSIRQINGVWQMRGTLYVLAK